MVTCNKNGGGGSSVVFLVFMATIADKNRGTMKQSSWIGPCIVHFVYFFMGMPHLPTLPSPLQSILNKPLLFLKALQGKQSF